MEGEAIEDWFESRSRWKPVLHVAPCKGAQAKKMKVDGPKGRHKYPQAPSFTELRSSHPVGELVDLFSTNLEFPDMRVIKIVEHSMIGMDFLMVQLQERCPSRWDRSLPSQSNIWRLSAW